MGTINEKINYLNQTKGLIREAIINKGVEVSEDDTFRSYADKISNIKNGGTGEDIDFEEITITPTTETQVKEGAFSKVTVEGIQGENLEIMPSSENQNFNGIYTNVSVVGDEDLIPDNIKKGTTIFGVEGNASVADFKITDGSYLFKGGARTDYLQQILSLCEKITSTYYMFDGCYRLTELDLSNLDTSEVTTMFYMFNGCNGLTKLDLSNFNTSKVTNMNNMFNECYRLTKLDLSNFNTSKVTTMYNMFYGCKGLTELDLSNFNTSEVTSIGGMFYQCSSLTKLDLSNFNTSKVTSMANMFYQCSNLKELDVSNFDTSEVTAMNNLFSSCTNLIELDLSNWDASKVKNTNRMFGSNYAMTVLKFMKNLGKGYNQKSNLSSYHSVDLQNSSKLTRENLISIMNDLYDLSLTYNVANGGKLYTQALTLGIANRNKLTPEDIAIVTNKRLDGKLERRNKMIFFNYTIPKMIVSEEGKHIRAKNDVYEAEHYDEDGNLVEEHFPHYSTTIFVPDMYTEEMANEDYVEEDILI